MTSINLYEILQLKNDCSQNDIKKSYRSYVKKLHPDKSGDKELFELVTHSFNILKDPKKRQEYDELHLMLKKSDSDHFTLKKNSEIYNKTIVENISDDEKEKKKREFEQYLLELEKKNEENIKLDTSNIGDKINDLVLMREMEDIENTDEKIFDDKFDINKFNKVFELMKNKNSNELVKTNIETVSGWDNLDNSSKKYCPLENDNSSYTTKITKKDLHNIENITNQDETDVDYEAKLLDRKQETELIMNYKLNDFSNEVLKNPEYGLSYQVGMDDKKDILDQVFLIENKYNDLIKKNKSN